MLLMVSMLLAFTSNVAQAKSKHKHKQGNFRINSVKLTDFKQTVDGALQSTGTVSGTLADLPFTADITNFNLQQVQDDPSTLQVECSVLSLEIAPINIALLGLHINTSFICLDITATEGGGLLGDLLCSLAGGGGIGGLAALPTTDQVGPLEDKLVDILNRGLGGNPSPAQIGPAQIGSVCEGDCEILPLALGPLEIHLLGLNVFLDDCADDSVQICISASQGEGLLGDLLCGLTGTDDLGNLTLPDIAEFATRAQGLSDDGSLSGRDRAKLRTLLYKLVR
jgi:hypothetical protein